MKDCDIQILCTIKPLCIIHCLYCIFCNHRLLVIHCDFDITIRLNLVAICINQRNIISKETGDIIGFLLSLLCQLLLCFVILLVDCFNFLFLLICHLIGDFLFHQWYNLQRCMIRNNAFFAGGYVNLHLIIFIFQLLSNDFCFCLSLNFCLCCLSRLCLSCRLCMCFCCSFGMGLCLLSICCRCFCLLYNGCLFLNFCLSLRCPIGNRFCRRLFCISLHSALSFCL